MYLWSAVASVNIPHVMACHRCTATTDRDEDRDIPDILVKANKIRVTKLLASALILGSDIPSRPGNPLSYYPSSRLDTLQSETVHYHTRCK